MTPRMQQAVAPLFLSLLASAGASGQAAVAAVTAAAALGSASAAGGVAVGVKALAEASQFAQTVDERLERDGEVLGEVVRHLHGLKNSTDKTAEDVLGKVYDMHSLQGFLSEHNVALKEHEQLGQEVARLANLVDSLSRELAMVQNMTAPWEAALAKTSSKRHLIETALALERTNAVLLEQNAQASLDLENITKEIESVRENTSAEQNASKAMEGVVLQQHHYAEECNRLAGHYESQLAGYEGLLAAVHSRGNRVLKVAEMTTKVHGIINEKNAVLKARIDKARANTATIQTQILTTKAEQEQLQKQAQAELAKLGEELGQHRTKIEEAKGELRYLKLESQAEQRMLEVAKAKVEKFQKALISGEIAKMRSNNTQLKAMLQQAHEAMQSSQAAVVKFETEIAEANQTLFSLRTSAKESIQQAEQVAQEALARIVEARRKDGEAVAQAQQAAMRVEGASLENCNATWDARHAALLQELDQCPPIELELKTVRAQVEALTNTISASAALQKVAG